ncbi:hypothetical protein [Actinomadura fibrosa]|uniref:Uncharacterized protein n=1 Tax=Actinomadura fibrosa TaxID=111802 RepID=A0ABW2XC44_9ACTN|nr:hypothetical protein [Actinomadura fibrosa]
MSNTLSLISMSTSDLAQILFSSKLQASDHPSPEQVRTAIDARLCDCDGDRSICAAFVAQEAGDHPETYAARMRWALTTVSAAYATAA